MKKPLLGFPVVWIAKPPPTVHRHTIRRDYVGRRGVTWHGPVERRDPASYAQPSISETWRCVTCRGEWTVSPSAAKGYCSRCGTARP